ncbi:hypothetical protein K9N68_08575 [Kovacikia minuta CCNUW1]|uniref:hypothetical protein n=1 Tax=Kovacikia minuta TaxID=2931930 RepID=UPI001CC93500|nr:hypothetical protein [Kovacikia minuta]UBF27935.1 hypothetical protein K9N68_08575 [Kovacikia minuta CCNUW1]
MQRFISFLGQILGKNLLVLGLVGLLSLSSVFFGVQQPAAAATVSSHQTNQERTIGNNKSAQQRERSYEEMAKDAKDAVNNPQELDEEYEQDLKAYKQEHRGEGGLVEGAKNLLEKTTNSK